MAEVSVYIPLWSMGEISICPKEYQILRMFWECCTYTKYQH